MDLDVWDDMMEEDEKEREQMDKPPFYMSRGLGMPSTSCVRPGRHSVPFARVVVLSSHPKNLVFLLH